VPGPLRRAPGVASPCINVCRMDTTSGWCEGCLRTLDEIAAWSKMGDEAKRGVWLELSQRRVVWRRLRQPPPTPAETP
jgi:uncharacterized protein